MKEKEKVIIDSALKFFAQKGYSSTSVQEIANDCGISKGAFYLYFKSKDSLLYTIMHYFYEEVVSAFKDIAEKESTPRQKMIEQMTFMLDHSLKHKDVIIMQTREQAIPLNDSIKQLIVQMQTELQQNTIKTIYEIYGDDSQKYLYDLLIIQEGLFHSFLKTLFLNQAMVTTQAAAEYILKRLDSVYLDIKESKEEPLVSNQFLSQLMRKPKINFMEHNNEKIIITIDTIRSKLEYSANKEDLEVSLDVLLEEVRNTEPRLPIIKGMLSNLHEHKASREEQKLIADFYHISI